MIPFGLRWRLAQGASSVTRQVAIGVMATVIASVLLPIVNQRPAAAPPVSKISLRIEPEAEATDAQRPLLQQASTSEVVPAAIPETHVAKAVVTHKPKPALAVLPPPRPRETPEVIEAAAPVGPTPAASGWDWLAPSRSAVDMTASALDVSKRWAMAGKDWAGRAAAGATAVVGQAVRLTP